MRLNKACLILILILASFPAATNAQFDLATEAEIVWQTYIDQSPRDLKSKDFLAPRIGTFIENLRTLQQQTNASNNLSRLAVSETGNKLNRDYKMLEATIRNLQQLSLETADARKSDLELLSSLGNIYGQAKIIAGQQ